MLTDVADMTANQTFTLQKDGDDCLATEPITNNHDYRQFDMNSRKLERTTSAERD